jgi:UDP-N-acetylglucosamine 4,6-dehydratase
VEFVIRCIGLMKGGEVFVPKIPSMRITDLAGVIAPDTPVKIMGIRAGEKIHESLISEDEARDTVELDDMYVVGRPDTPWGHVDLPQGRRLPAGFRYTSDTNALWLSADGLRALVARE